MKRRQGRAVKVLAALLLAGGAVMLGVTGWQALAALLQPQPVRDVRPATAASVASIPADAIGPSGSAPASQRAAAAVLPAAASSAAAPARAIAFPSTGTERFEVCGHGQITAPDLERLYPVEVQLETRQRLIEALGRGSEREQAVGWLMASQLAVDRATARSGPACGADSNCAVRATALASAEVAAALQGLIGLARASNDAGVYALAVTYGCRGTQTAQPACAGLSPAEWRRRLPGDAAPWLWQADLASQQRDTAAVHAALAQAAREPRLSPLFGDPYAPLLALPMWRAMAPMQQMDALVGMIGASAALPYTSMDPVLQFCKPEELSQPGRREACDGLIRHFTADSATALHLVVGLRIAQRAGWSGDRLQEIEERRNAWEAFSRREGLGDIFSCKGIANTFRGLRETAALGELAAMRKYIDDSGRPWADWVEQGRQSRQLRERGETPSR